jgi:hypothetical protein
MMDEATQRKIHGVNEQYRAHLRQIADSVEIDPEEKRRQATAGYQAALSMQREATAEWSAALDKRGAELEEKLYHGNKDYKEAVRSLSGRSAAEIEEAARIASRTGDTELARAAAVVAREKGNHQVFFDYVQGNDEFSEAFTELAQIPEPAERRRFVQQFAVRPADARDLQPSRQAIEAHQRAQDAERVRRRNADGSILGARLL